MNLRGQGAKSMWMPSSSVSGKSEERDNFPAGLRVLVVDDDRTCLMILEKMLLKCLCKVTKCNRAEIALSLLRKNKNGYDIVISDVHMPDMDGFKLLEHIGLEMDLPVIMVSADDRSSVVMKGVTHGACNYLIKPVQIEALKIIWQHVIRKRKHEWKNFEQSGGIQDGELQQKPSDDADFSSLANEEAVPKKIKKLMKVPRPARENFATHHQRGKGNVSATMAEDQPFLRTQNPTDDIITSNFSNDFKIYVKKQELHWQHGKFSIGWVFWSGEDYQCNHPPLDPCSQIINSAFKTVIAVNHELTQKIKSMIEQMVSYSKEQVLVQFWKAIESGGRRLLTTRDQPFGLNRTNNEGLCSYRLISLDYEFYVDGESDQDLGLPSRVFQNQQWESTPDVRYYSCKEYPQRDHAVISKIRGSWACPVLESSVQCCVGVLEVVTTAEIKRSFPYLQNWTCTEVELVGLRSSVTCNHLYYEHDNDEALEDALVEIREVLEVVCRTHYLPLAQTWVPCRLCNVMFRNHATCLREKDKSPFLKVCASYNLCNGQGVVGRAFSSHNLVFCKDITQFSIAEYPLAHYTRGYGLKGCFSICLRSSYTGHNVYVLEFFLSPSNIEGRDPRITLVPLLTTMKQNFRSFKVASREELGEELSIEVIDFSKDGKLYSFQIRQTARSPVRMNGGEMVWSDLSNQQLIEVDAIDTKNNSVSNTKKTIIAAASLEQKCIINSSLRQHRKAGIPISFEDVQQHFGMKLNDAAKSLGVSRSTLKRACREYNITWWSRRKRNKDDHSLSNEFVQGAAQEQIQESSQPPISDQPRKQDLATAACTEAHLMAAHDTDTVTIKAKYGDDFIKFQLPLLSGMVKFRQQVAKRLNLKRGTYSVKYQDDDNDWILIACDEDLQDYICNLRSLGRNTITVSLQPITVCPP